jgi:hypothetical protein
MKTRRTPNANSASVYTQITDTESEFSGKDDVIKFRNTPYDRKRVMANDTFSPLCAGMKNAQIFKSPSKISGNIKFQR